MTNTIGLVENVNKRYPIGVRRLAIGREIEAAILSEVKVAKRLNWVLIGNSMILLGLSVGNFYVHSLNELYRILIPVFSIIVMVLVSCRYLRAKSAKVKYSLKFGEPYANAAKRYIERNVVDLRPDLPTWMDFIYLFSPISVLLDYERTLVSLLILCGDLQNHKLSKKAQRQVQCFVDCEKLPRQAAMSALNREGGPSFVYKVFRSILKTNQEVLTPVQESIAAAKAELSTPEVRALSPSERPQAVHKKVAGEFNNCWTSVGQIEEDIAKNRHPSLDKILRKFERLDSP